MTQKHLYDNLSSQVSKKATKLYSTSFSLGILLFSKPIRPHIYAIYGFVRLADEIVDTFMGYEQERLLNEFEQDTYKAIEEGISLNPILNSFQATVREFDIPLHLIDAFLKSMRMDLHMSNYSQEEVSEYIYGSAEVVGLMCLKIFCNDADYERLSPHAKSLGAAFQKVNFLRDLKDDYQLLGRTYFEDIDFANFDSESKKKVEADMRVDFDHALEGIKQLPMSSRFGVYIAFIYYHALLRKIERTHYSKVAQTRIRISDPAKYYLLIKSWFLYKLRLV